MVVLGHDFPLTNLGKIYKFRILSLLIVGEIKWRHADTWWRRILRRMGLADDVRKEHNHRREQIIRLGLMIGVGLTGNVAQAKLNYPEQLVIPETVAVADYADYIKQTVIELNPGINPDSAYLNEGTRLLSRYAERGIPLKTIFFERALGKYDDSRIIDALIESVPQEAYRPTLRDYFQRNGSTMTVEKATEMIQNLPKSWYAAQVGDTYRVSDVLEREYGSWFTSLVDAEKERLMHAIVDHNPNAGYGVIRDENNVRIALEERYQIQNPSPNQTVLLPHRDQAQNLLNYDSRSIAQYDGQNLRN